MKQMKTTEGVRKHLEEALVLAQNPEQKRHIRESVQLLESMREDAP